MSISNNIASIQANTNVLNVTANNIANVNTEGFVPKDAKISTQSNSLHVNIREADNNGSKKSQTDLAKEIPDEIIAQESVAVNVNVIKTQNEMMGTLLDIKT
ncbi:flagellar basal body protein [Sulfurimonas sp. NW15]|uniref:flagellar basal body protein n=1 Tax=unclassified Sulfurimonas TaxID=2623549 RepID=UPI0032049678